MDLEHKNGKTAPLIKVSGTLENPMEMVDLFILMVIRISANSMMETIGDLGPIIMPMVDNKKVFGKITC